MALGVQDVLRCSSPEMRQPRILDRVIGALSDCSRVQEFDLHPHAEDLSSSG